MMENFPPITRKEIDSLLRNIGRDARRPFACDDKFIEGVGYAIEKVSFYFEVREFMERNQPEDLT